MWPRDHDADDGANDSDSGSSSGSEGSGSGSGSGADDEWVVDDPQCMGRALAALDALRKARQHYDVVLTAGGVEVPAHRALLAAASPYLLRALPAVGGGPEPLVCRVLGVEGAALAALVQWVYSGRLAGRGAAGARALYGAAWRLRAHAARPALADTLLRRLTPADALAARALPDLPDKHVEALDAYIGAHFDAICASGALSALPSLRVELVACSSAAGTHEAPKAIADAVLAWLKAAHGTTALDVLVAHTHLVYVDAAGALRDCDELPASQAGAEVIREYRAQAAARNQLAEEDDDEDGATGELVLGERAPKAEWRTVAARGARGAGGVTHALLALGGRLAAARVAWRDVGAGVARGGPLGGAREAAAKGERRAALQGGRAAMGAAAMNGRLLVCGGYDRARVLREAAAYEPASNRWSPLPPMRVARARFPAVTLGGALFVLGGSDGHNELDSVDVYEENAPGPGLWRGGGRLPLAVALAGAAADEGRGELWLVGGWAGGRPLKATHSFRPDDSWQPGPPLITARSQVCCVEWGGALWALGGCDAWHCLATTETLVLGGEGGAWAAGPPLPTARRSVGGAAWRGALLAAGGSDGAQSLARCDRLTDVGAGWVAAPALREPRAACALAPLEGVLYAVGGFDGKEFLSSVECLYEPDGEWTSLCAPPPPAAPPAAPLDASLDAAGEKEKEKALDKAAPKEVQPPMVNGDGAH